MRYRYAVIGHLLYAGKALHYGTETGSLSRGSAPNLGLLQRTEYEYPCRLKQSGLFVVPVPATLIPALSPQSPFRQQKSPELSFSIPNCVLNFHYCPLLFHSGHLRFHKTLISVEKKSLTFDPVHTVPLAPSNSVHHSTSNVSIKILQICLLQLIILFVNIVKL